MQKTRSSIRNTRWLKGALVALLLGCVGIGVWGEWLVFQIIRADIRQHIRARMEATVPEEGLVLIKIATGKLPTDFHFTEAEREFRYKGQMYDIVRREIHHDSTYYYCIHDIRESQLYADFEQQVQEEFSTNPQHQTKHHNLLKKIPDFYLLSTNSIFFGVKYFSTPKPLEMNRLWLDAPLTILVPPPEIA